MSSACSLQLNGHVCKPAAWPQLAQQIPTYAAMLGCLRREHMSWTLVFVNCKKQIFHAVLRKDVYSSNEIGKAQNNNYELNVNYIPLILFDVEAIGVS